jgi:hypothetical protein
MEYQGHVIYTAEQMYEFWDLWIENSNRNKFVNSMMDKGINMHDAILIWQSFDITYD